jgi:hypothetical protein
MFDVYINILVAGRINVESSAIRLFDSRTGNGYVVTSRRDISEIHFALCIGHVLGDVGAGDAHQRNTRLKVASVSVARGHPNPYASPVNGVEVGLSVAAGHKKQGQEN